MKIFSPLLLASVLLPVGPAWAQFGDLGKKLKDKANTVLQEKLEEKKDDLAEKTESKQEEFDTTTFNYAIAFLDKSESFENLQNGERLIKSANFLLNDDQQTELDAARDLYELGRLNFTKRSYFLGEYYLKQAEEAFEDLRETNHPVYLKALGALGLLYSNMGRYELAQDYTHRALEGWSKTYGETSSGYAAEFSNQAVLAFNLGNYNDAEEQLARGLKLIKEVEGSKSVPYAIVLNNLGILYQYMGRSEEALEQVNATLIIAEEELREKSGTYIQFMTNKALIQQENGDFQAAEATYNKAIELQTSRLKLNRKSDPDYAHLLNHLASLYVITGRSDDAEKLLKESLEIYISKFGETHPSTASAQTDLGNLYRHQGRYPEAEKLLKTSFSTRKSTLGLTHPHTVQGQEDLAVVHWLMGKADQAAAEFTLVMDYSISFINEFFPPMSEVEKTKYWEKMKPRFYTYFNFAFDQCQNKPELLGQALNYRLATKGLLLSSTTKIRQTIMGSGDQQLIGLYTSWQDQKRALATYYSLSKEEIREQGINIDSLEAAANQTERALSKSSSAFANAFVSKEVKYQEVMGQLKNSACAIEIIHFPTFKKSLSPEMRYAAIVLDQSHPQPELVILENGDQLDGRYYGYYNNVIKQKLNDEYSFAQYWEAIEAKISGTGLVYLSPDGVYNQINVNTLRYPTGEYLVQKREVRLVGNLTDLLNKKPTATVTNEAFLLGFPSYGTKEVAPLPGTALEVKQISTVLRNQYKVVQVTGQDATETRVKQMRSPRLVHMATHGYFLADVQSRNKVFGVQIEHARNNPLLRSGLMLTGAARGIGESAGDSFHEDDNGILTAYEAMNLNLGQTELVVLSACETGKGDIKSGEGVYGLQRAFMIAGAPRMVMSLWKVDDTATQELMSLFYQNWAQKGQDLHQAFRQAQLQLISRYPEPYYWGAFVMVGG